MKRRNPPPFASDPSRDRERVDSEGFAVSPSRSLTIAARPAAAAPITSHASGADDAWKKVKGLPTLDAARHQLVQSLAAWRERRADERNRPRGWILDDAALREIVLHVPRSLEALAALP